MGTCTQARKMRRNENMLGKWGGYAVGVGRWGWREQRDDDNKGDKQ
jgi:hypothetical protein